MQPSPQHSFRISPSPSQNITFVVNSHSPNLQLQATPEAPRNPTWFLFLGIHLFWTIHINWIKSILSFASGFSLAVTVFRFTHVVADGSILFFWLLSSSIQLYGCPTFVYLFANWQTLGLFPAWEYYKWCWTFVYKSLCGHVLSFSWVNTWEWNVWIICRWMLNFSRSYQTFFAKQLYLFHFYHWGLGVPVPQMNWHLLWLVSLILDILIGV